MTDRRVRDALVPGFDFSFMYLVFSEVTSTRGLRWFITGHLQRCNRARNKLTVYLYGTKVKKSGECHKFCGVCV